MSSRAGDLLSATVAPPPAPGGDAFGAAMTVPPAGAPGKPLEEISANFRKDLYRSGGRPPARVAVGDGRAYRNE